MKSCYNCKNYHDAYTSDFVKCKSKKVSEEDFGEYMTESDTHVINLEVGLFELKEIKDVTCKCWREK